MTRTIHRCFGLVFLLILGTVGASAFKPGIHGEITKMAMEDLTFIWSPPESVKKALNGNWFTKTAIEEVVNANMAKDIGDCDPKPDQPTKLCGVDGVLNILPDSIGQALNGLYLAELSNTGDHFDDERIQLGSNQLWGARNRILSALAERRYVAARKELGGALHGLQDFYSHSNWVDLGLTTLETRLGTDPRANAFASGLPRLAGRDEPMCAWKTSTLGVDGSVLLTDLTPAEIAEATQYLLPYMREIVEKSINDRPLTSGYFSADQGEIDAPRFETPKEIRDNKKCAHGLDAIGLINLVKGINKDSSLSDRHNDARRIAYLHSMAFINDILDTVKEDLVAVLGFMGHPTVLSLGPSTVSPGTDGLRLRLTGADFMKSSKVLWNGNPRDTEFANNTTLYASITAADLARPGIANISVSNEGFNSNDVPFSIAGDFCECRSPQILHIHDKTWLDVNAHMWNDTGIVVKRGDLIRVQVRPGGLIAWRRGLISNDIAAPQGDRSARPSNTMFWLDPQIPNLGVAAIGSLIGLVLPPDAPPPTEKPEGGRYFPIGSGREAVMEADGKLFVGVNDGSFYNNLGCFQVKVARAQ